MNNSFGNLLGFASRAGRRGSGKAGAVLDVRDELLNPHGVVHGGVLFSIADTVMGAALYTTLAPGESCTTIEIKIHFLQPVTKGKIRCSTRLVHRGSRIAVLESHLSVGRRQVAQALGTFAIFAPRPAPAKSGGAKRPRLSK
jgi:acyl-CoA thioesterase